MTEKPKIDALETEQLLKSMGYTVSFVIHDNGLVMATAISGRANNDLLQVEIDAALLDLRRTAVSASY